MSPGCCFYRKQTSFQIALIDLGRHGTRCLKPLVLFPGDRHLDLLSNRLRQLGLDSKHIAQLSIVGSDQKCASVAPRINWAVTRIRLPLALRILPQWHPRSAFGNLRHGELWILESHHRSAGNDAQVVHPGEASDQRFGHPITQVFLGWISRKVLQRQYRQRPDFGLRGVPGAAMEYDVSGGKQGQYTTPARASHARSEVSHCARDQLPPARAPFLSCSCSPCSPPKRCLRLCNHASSSEPGHTRIHVCRVGDGGPACFPLLPALNRGHIAPQIGCDFLPRIQLAYERFLGRGNVLERRGHDVRSPDCNARSLELQKTVFDGKWAFPHIAV